MKRTEQIAIRISPELKKALSNLAKENDWTIAHTANRILEKSLGITPVQKEDERNDAERE